jgi:ABC-type glutathione transport system ATPase component
LPEDSFHRTNGQSAVLPSFKSTIKELLDGVDVLKLRRGALHEQRKRMQMILQDPVAALDPGTDIGSAIAEPILVNKFASRAQACDKVNDPLQRVGLQPGMARGSRTNSRAANASASASRPPLRWSHA